MRQIIVLAFLGVTHGRYAAVKKTQTPHLLRSAAKPSSRSADVSPHAPSSRHWGQWDPANVEHLVAQWPSQKLAKLQRMANKTMWSAMLNSAIPHDPQGKFYFVQAGDLPQMWLRDSTASLHHLFTSGTVERSPFARQVVEGLARTLARYINKDKYCSAWEPYDNGRECRGGGTYTDMRFELDSPMYVLRMLRLLKAHGSTVTSEPEVQRALKALVQLSREQQSSTKLLKTESRPSDDSAEGFNIPDNFFAAVELAKVGEITGDKATVHAASQLSHEIMGGITKFGMRNAEGLGKVYCYEATAQDCLIMDDANVPSLLALPYLSQDTGLLDEETYGRTRQLVLSQRDPFYYSSNDGHLSGIGSPHLPGRKVWPMSLLSRALTAKDDEEVAQVLDMLVNNDGNKELMHESVDVDTGAFTRSWFDWPNSLFAELVDRCCSGITGTRTNAVPRNSFEGWQTCGFRSSVCSLKGTSLANPSMLETEGRGDGTACVRFGTAFGGFNYKRVALAEFPVSCNSEVFGSAPFAGAFEPCHCAVAPSSSCDDH